MKPFFLALTTLFIALPLTSRNHSDPDFTVPFAVYDGDTLSVDVYMPNDSLETHHCVIYSYGGGFVDNNQREESTMKFCRRLADDGYVAIASDYRLGLRGVVMKGVLSMVKPLKTAVGMAVEDVYKVVNLALDNAAEWKIDPEAIVLCGSSAGAVTSLQCDYELCNRTPVSAIIPEDFRFAGIISFSGAVFSTDGPCKFRVHDPAPVLLLHGMKDKLVIYDNMAFFNLRLSGSKDLVKRYARSHLPYEIIRFRDEGHGVAARIFENYDDVVWFIENMVKGGRHLEIDKTVSDRDRTSLSWDRMSADSLYGK